MIEVESSEGRQQEALLGLTAAGEFQGALQCAWAATCEHMQGYRAALSRKIVRDCN